MVGDDRPIRRAACDVVLVLLDHDGAAHGAGVLHPEREADREDEHAEDRSLVDSWPPDDRLHDAVDQERDQDRREGELHVGDAHDERVDRAADIAGDRARA